MKDKRYSTRISTDNSNYHLRKRQQSIHKKRRTLNLFKENNLSKIESDSSKKFSNASNSKMIIINQKPTKLIDPDSYIYDSEYLLMKPRDFVSFCNELKTLEIQNRNFYQINNGINDIEDEFDFWNMNNNYY